MKLLFILDPLESLKIHKDTSLAMMREASHRGHHLFVSMQHDLFLRGSEARIKARNFKFTGQSYTLGKADEMIPANFDAVLMRKDPPFDNEYLYSTYVLEIAAAQGAKVFNNPTAIRGWNEKLSVSRFPQFAPEFLVTANNALIREFLNLHQDIVVKPLDGMGAAAFSDSDWMTPISVLFWKPLPSMAAAPSWRNGLYRKSCKAISALSSFMVNPYLTR